MKIGLFTPVFGKLDLDGLLVELKKYPQIRMLELGTGGYPQSSHLRLHELLAEGDGCRTYQAKIEDAGLQVSALSCHGNALHPQSEIAAGANAVFRDTVLLAEKMKVPVVVTFAGCPGGSAADMTPNWITTAWPPECAEALRWQWEAKIIPYWKDATRFAADHGIKVALEAHPGFAVYNTETLLRLRKECGDNLGLNLDPSHLWWQGMDPCKVIRAAGSAIFHVHAKDVALDRSNIAENGVLDAKDYRKMLDRSWTFRSVGWGHDLLEWRSIVSTLRLVGYDYALSIEHEDALASVEEGLNFALQTLTSAVLDAPPVEAWWI